MKEILEKSFKKEARSEEELRIYNMIQVELMKRLSIDGLKWAEKYSANFRELYDLNKPMFEEIYKRDPNELYALLEAVLGKEN